MRRQVYGATREEVSRKVAALVAQAAAGIPASATTWTLALYVEHWREHIARGSLRPSTIENYGYVLDRHVLPRVGRRRLSAITPAHVRQLMADLSAAGLSSRTQQLCHAVLRSILAHAVRDELVARNVAGLVRAPRSQREEVKPWSPEEAGEFLRAVREHRLYALFAVGLGLGLRKGELLALAWDDVDLATGFLRVRRTVYRMRDGSGLVFGPPKSARSRRTIPLPAVCAAALREHRARQAAERLEAGERWVDHGLVFPSSVGTPIEPRNLNRVFVQLTVAVGSGGSGCMTCVTPAPRCCWPRVCRLGW